MMDRNQERPDSPIAAADPILVAASDGHLFRLSYFANYGDAFYVAQRRADLHRVDYGLERIDPNAQVPCDVADQLGDRVIGRKLPRAAFRIFMVPVKRFRQGYEVRCQVVEPQLMTDEEFRGLDRERRGGS